jgi:polysaccharide biosynthesis protein PslH
MTEREDKPLTGRRLACLMGRVPWPVDDGWRMRSSQLSKAWAEMGAEVHLFALRSEDEMIERPAPVHFSTVAVVPRRKAYRPSDILLGLISRTPLPIRNYAEPALATKIREATSRTAFDVVVVEDIAMAQYAHLFGDACVVLDMHNVESHLMRRYAIGQTSIPRKLYALATSVSLKHYERRVSKDFAGLMVCSADDKTRIESIGFSGTIRIVPNGIDLERFAEPLGPPSSQDLVFVGSMDYHANISGILHFCKSIFPRIQEWRPDVKLRIVGKNPPSEVLHLASKSIDVTGRVNDVRPYFAASAVSIVPLLVGGGTRLKILESMAFGRPVVSTTLGAEGLDFRGEDVIRLADSSTDFAKSIRQLLDRPAEAHELGSRGREFVSREYGWERIGMQCRPFMRSVAERKRQGERPFTSVRATL